MAAFSFNALLVFWLTWRKRPDFIYMFIGLIFYTLGHIFLIIKHYIDLFTYLGNAVILLALLIVAVSSVIEYVKLIVTTKKEKNIFGITIAFTVVGSAIAIIIFYVFDILSILNAIMLPMIFLLIPSTFFILRIYIKQQTITRLFIFSAFISATLAAISTILAAYYEWGLASNIALNFVFQTFILTGGLSALAEAAVSDSDEKYRLLSEQLEEKVIDRTRQIEMVNTELEAFSYSVSHDLRTPLRSISGFANILKKEYGIDLDEKGQDYINRIMDNTERMNELINDLLDLAHISRTDFIIEEINLTKITNEIILNFKQLYPERDIDFNIEEDIIANCDAKLIRIVIENLLSNAVKFTRTKQSAKIVFETMEQDNQRVYVIRDDGIGFDMAYYEKLFGLFQRLHSSKEFEGTGIGLVTVKRIIERHKGKIWAEAKVDEGATFYFTLS